MLQFWLVVRVQAPSVKACQAMIWQHDIWLAKSVNHQRIACFCFEIWCLAWLCCCVPWGQMALESSVSIRSVKSHVFPQFKHYVGGSSNKNFLKNPLVWHVKPPVWLINPIRKHPRNGVGWHTTQPYDPWRAKDLCSGLGFLGMFLSELLPPDRVQATCGWVAHRVAEC